MNEVCNKAEQLLNSIFESAQFEVRASGSESETGCLLSMEGADTGLLLNQGGELLDALQHIVNQAYGRTLPKGQRIVCDADNYRATRESEWTAIARYLAPVGPFANVRSSTEHAHTSQPFRFQQRRGP